MTEATLRHVIQRVIDNAMEAAQEGETEKGEFQEGMKLAFYETLDIIKNELIIEGDEPEEYGLGIDLEKTFL